MIKVGIVGPEESKWAEEQKKEAKIWIRLILQCMKMSNKCVIPINDKQIKTIDLSSPKVLYPITLVSGGCHKGGVDIWAEESADELGIQKEIIKPDIHQWEDKVVTGINHYQGKEIETEYEMMGYKSRNIIIAQKVNILFCVVPFNDKIAHTCMHHMLGEGPLHPQNGGCWTAKYCREVLNKETHLIVIK